MPPSAPKVVEEHRELLRLTERLVREYQPATSAGAVIATVTRCRDELTQAGVRAGLAVAVESMTRARLRHGIQPAGSHVEVHPRSRTRRVAVAR